MIILAVVAVVVAARRLPAREALAAAWLGSLLVAPHIYVSDYLVALPSCLLLSRLNRLCFFPSLLLLFPMIPVGMLFSERLVLMAPLLALLCLIAAAFVPGREAGLPAEGKL